MIPTSELREILLDPLAVFPTLPEPVFEIFRLWADRLEPEMAPTDLMTSYFGVLRDLQEGVDHRTGQPMLSPLAGQTQVAYRLFFVMFPHLIPHLLGARAEEVLQVWREVLPKFSPQEGEPSV